MSDSLEDDLRADARYERRLFWKVLAIVALVAAVAAARTVLG